MSKTKTIKLTDGWAPSNPNAHKTSAAWDAANRYRVEQVTDSIRFRIGQMLEREDVEALCASSEWRVTITTRRDT